jgi:hypothetical protein
MWLERVYHWLSLRRIKGNGGANFFRRKRPGLNGTGGTGDRALTRDPCWGAGGSGLKAS